MRIDWSNPGQAPRAVAGRGVAVAALCVFAVLAQGCDRRPGDPPKPTTQFSATPVTAGLAGLSGPAERGTRAISPASDPPPSPIPQPAEPPASPASR